MPRGYALDRLKPYIIEVSRVIRFHQQEVDNLNVFPIPDGDTGTNMLMTWEGVAEAVRQLPPTATMSDIWDAIEHGALHKARGNSGVILSQIIKGAVSVLRASKRINTKVLAESLSAAARYAHDSVTNPKEGTILTVISTMADAAEQARKKRKSLKSAVGMVAEAATAAVQTTPELLSRAIGKKIAVVDAGGYGLSLMFRAVYDLITGQVSTDLDLLGLGIFTTEPTYIDDVWMPGTPPYDTQGLVKPSRIFGEVEEAKLRNFLSSLGNSELVVSSQDLVRIHVHTDTPERVLAELLHIGEVHEFAVENMRLQVAARTILDKPIAIVAVAAGEGFRHILTSDFSVDIIIDGGQTSNPDVGTILQAIRQVRADSVIVLPSNRNVILAAQAAASSAIAEGKDCRVVPTTNLQETIAAIVALDPDRSLDQNIADMAAAASRTTTGAVAVAQRSSETTDGELVAAEDYIGISGSDVLVAADTLSEATIALTKRLLATREESSLITLFGGKDLQREQAIVEAVTAAFPDLDIEYYRGDQPIYTLLISVE